MYTDALPPEKGANLKEEDLESPRLTVYTTLAEILSSGDKVRHITVCGHSLGGALASLCGYDLATAVDRARTGATAEVGGRHHITS